MSLLGIAGSVIGGLIQSRENEKNRQFQAEQAHRDRRENYMYGEMSADAADARTRALYEDYESPEAMLRQYRAAGLSPSLMFGGSGAGGASMPNGAQGTGANGISTQYGAQAFNPMDAAQLGLMQAQAAKLNAETETIKGQNERGETEIALMQKNIRKIIEETHNVGLHNAYMEYENALQSLKVGYEASTFETKIENYIKETEYLQHKVRSAAVKADIDETTKKDVEKLVHENVKNVLADTLLKNAQKHLAEEQKRGVAKGIELTQQQIEDLLNQIENRNKNTKVTEDRLKQDIREWALKNGIVIGDETNLGEYWQKVLWSEHSHETLIKLLDIFLN